MLILDVQRWLHRVLDIAPLMEDPSQNSHQSNQQERPRLSMSDGGFATCVIPRSDAGVQ
jgi:hypothetical protein